MIDGVKEGAIAAMEDPNWNPIPLGDKVFQLPILGEFGEQIRIINFTPEIEQATPIYRAIRILANCLPGQDEYEGARKARFNATTNRWSYDFAWFLQKELHICSRNDVPFRHAYMRAYETHAEIYLALLDVCKFIDNNLPQDCAIAKNAWQRWIEVMIEVRLTSLLEGLDDKRDKKQTIEDLEQTLKSLKLKKNPCDTGNPNEAALFNLFEIAVNLASDSISRHKEARQISRKFYETSWKRLIDAYENHIRVWKKGMAGERGKRKVSFYPEKVENDRLLLLNGRHPMQIFPPKEPSKTLTNRGKYNRQGIKSLSSKGFGS